MHLSINFCDGTDIIIRKNTFACFIAKNINEEDRVRFFIADKFLRSSQLRSFLTLPQFRRGDKFTKLNPGIT